MRSSAAIAAFAPLEATAKRNTLKQIRFILVLLFPVDAAARQHISLLEQVSFRSLE